MGNFDSSIRVDVVVSGKLRRYNHLNLVQQLVKVKTIVIPNTIDMIKVMIGTWQSVAKLIMWRPDIVFTKGGFVCLPIGMAAHFLGIPLVIHDSDAHPGLTNRILARFARYIGTGAPLKFYSYPSAKARYVGVPVNPEYTPFTLEQRQKAKQALGFDAQRPLIVVTGGGLGARRINEAVARDIDSLMAHTNVILISGKNQYDAVREITPDDTEHYKLLPFVSEGMAQMLGAADIVVTRAGATTILELAALAKPTILVPNAYLTGGHQLKNAAVYAENGAVCVLDEEELEKNIHLLSEKVAEMLADTNGMRQMGERFSEFARPDAAKDMAQLIIAAIK